MNEDLKEMRYLYNVLEKRSDTYPFKIGEIWYLLDLLHKRIIYHLTNCEPIHEDMKLYEKIARCTDAQWSGDEHPVEIELTGAEAYIVLLLVFLDKEDTKMRTKLFYDLYLGIENMTINTPDEEENI